MLFQLTSYTHVRGPAATTIAASPRRSPPSLREATTSDAFCNALSGREGRITAEYNPLLASYAAAAAVTLRLPPWTPPVSCSRLPMRRPHSSPHSRLPPEPTTSAARPRPQQILQAVASTGLTGPRSPPRQAHYRGPINQKMNAYRATLACPLVVSDGSPTLARGASTCRTVTTSTTTPTTSTLRGQAR